MTAPAGHSQNYGGLANSRALVLGAYAVLIGTAGIGGYALWGVSNAPQSLPTHFVTYDECRQLAAKAADLPESAKAEAQRGVNHCYQVVSDKQRASAPPSAPTQPVGGCAVNMRNYERLNDGISYWDAVEVMGCEGREAARSTFASTTTVIRQMRGEDIDLRRQEWWKSHRNDTSPYGIPDDHSVLLNDFALNELKGLSQPRGFIFQSPRKRHNGQATLVELELAIQWRSGITEKIRELSNVPGDWTMKEVRRSAIILSGLQRVEQMYTEDAPDARKAALERALKEWSRKLFKAMEDQRSAFDALLPEEEVLI